MDKHLPPISIEKFAAYLDGNLSQEEMGTISSLANDDDSIKQLLDANSDIEETLSSYKSEDLILPKDIESMSFEIPQIRDNIHPLITLSPEPFIYTDVAAASSDADISFGDSDNLFGDSEISSGSDNYNHQLKDNDISTETDLTSNITDDL